MYAKIIVNLSLDRSFDYRIPPEIEGEIRPGVQVMVPFGKSTRQGYVVGLTEKSDYPESKLKSIVELCGHQPKISKKLMDLGEWLGEYYCCSREQAVRALLPGAVRSGKIRHKTRRFYFIPSAEKAQEHIFEHGKRAPAQAKILQVLLNHPGMAGTELKKEADVGDGPIRALIKEKLIEVESREERRNPFAHIKLVPSLPLKATGEQAGALKTINEMLAGKTSQHTLLLHGVTGSGKTEVYLQAIAKVIDDDREAIVLVPEIALTPQTVERFRARFDDRVSVLHSALSDGERYDEWTRINRGQVKIVVGARSALFAPFRKLGLIIVDEEHESSYKQEEAPRYHARDVAVMRGLLEKAVVILGSATPSLESWHNARIGKYLLSTLSKRIDDCLMPEMQAVDMRVEAESRGGAQIFSRDLTRAVYERLERGEQSILFLNRRGFATQMLCQQCGFVAECPDCSISYTFHRQRNSLSCHLCGALLPAPNKCPKCGDENIRYTGLGTEKVEAAAAKVFKGANIRRMDSDTMTAKHCYEDVLREFRSGRIDILIGTQMIAKGLHFPNVTLVGIIFADLSLHIPDFRSAERTFQLLTQVSGRAGRGEIPGEVIVQTYTPNNPAIQYALNHDFSGFCEEEYELREALGYPPCGHLIAVHFRGENEVKLAKFAEDFRQRINPALNSGITVSGPIPAPIARIKKRYRYLILMRGLRLAKLRAALRHEALHGKHPKGIEMYIDADAINMM